MKSMDPKLSNDTQFFKIRPFYDDVAPFQLIPIFFIDFQDFSIIFLNLFKHCLNIEMYN